MVGSSPETREEEAAAAIALLPSARLGFLLSARRKAAGVGALPAAQAGGIELSELHDIESGRTVAEAGVLAALLAFYGVPLGEFVPPRQPLVVPHPDATSEEIVRAYVDAVRAWRKAGRKEQLRFRQSDILTLAEVLGTDPDEMERRLIAFAGCSRKEARRLRKLFLAAMVTVPLATGLATGSVSLAAAQTPAHSVAITRTADVRTDGHRMVRSNRATTAVKTVVGVLQADPTKAATTHAAGISSAVVAVHWSQFAPRQGSIDQAYVSQIRAEINEFTAAGMRVILSPGLANPPAWVFGLNSSTRFVDQYGNVWHGDSPGEDVPDAVFDLAVRHAQDSYLAALGQALTGMPIYSVRAGGLANGELRYPSAGSTNSYWAYDSAAQAQSPVPGWRPGDPGKAKAAKFLHWYLGSLTSYQNALVKATAQAFPSSKVMVLYPAWGIRPGQIQAALADGLNGTSLGEQYGSLQEGLDWASQVASLPAGTIVYTTNLAAANQAPGTTGEAPIYYLASLAAQRGLPVAGENAGDNNDVDLARCVQRAHALGLTDMLWMNEADLYNPSPGAPSLAQLGAAAHDLSATA